MTRQDVKQLMESATSEQDWNAKRDKVKAAHQGQYPDYWYVDIIMGGVLSKAEAKWPKKGAVNVSNDTFGGFTVFNLMPEVFDNPVSSAPVNDEPTFSGFGGGDFGGGGAGSSWDSGSSSSSDSSSSDSGSGD